MTEAGRFRRLRALFDDAVELPPEERTRFVESACGDDTDMCRELERLLAREHQRKLLDADHMVAALDRTLRIALPTAFVEGQHLGPFRVIELLGGGGMGRVYRASRCDGAVEQEVAVKLVRGDLFDAALTQRFSAERRLLATLDHPNICRFLDAGALPDGTPYVVMEFVRGQPLLHYCDRHRLTIDQRVRLLRKICNAVEHAHRNLIVHRDIKSENILVTEEGEPKLLDFGIGKLLSGNVSATQTAERFLTPSNAAPEQLRGEAAGVGCDIYALGLLAFELLGGRPAFNISGMTAGEVERHIFLIPAPLLSTHVLAGSHEAALSRGLPSKQVLASELAGDVDAIIATCLRKSSDERYPSVSQLDADLACLLVKLPISVRHDDRGYRLRKFVARHRIAVALAVALAVVLMATLTIVGWLAFDLAAQRNVAIRERDHAEHVIRILQDAIVAADPAQVAGETLTMREVLAQARIPLDKVFDSQPALYAVLAATMAEVELSLGNDTVASDLVERALQAIKRTAPDNSLLRRLLLLHGQVLTNTGDIPGAVRTLDKVRELDRSEQFDWMIAYGRVLMRQARFDESADVLEDAVAKLGTRQPDDELANQAHWELAKALRYARRFDDALEVNQRTRRWQRERLDETHPRLVITGLNRVDILWAAGLTQQAVDEGRQIHAEIARIYGSDSLMAARASSMLALALSDAGQLAAAIELNREVLQVWREKLGIDHSLTIRGTYNLASMLVELNEGQQEADQLFRTAVQAAERRFGLSSNVTHFMRIGFAESLLDRRRYLDALELLTSGGGGAGLAELLPDNRAEYIALLKRAVEGQDCVTEPKPACASARELVRQSADN